VASPGIADHALGCCWALTRKLNYFIATRTEETGGACPTSAGTRGKTAVVSDGGIGSQVAAGRTRAACACRVDPKDCREPVRGEVRLSGPPGHVLPLADVVFVCAPETPESGGMIGKRQFADEAERFLHRRFAGRLYDMDALVDALRSRKVAGAGVDVTVPEPAAAGPSAVEIRKRHHHAARGTQADGEFRAPDGTSEGQPFSLRQGERLRTSWIRRGATEEPAVGHLARGAADSCRRIGPSGARPQACNNLARAWAYSKTARPVCGTCTLRLVHEIRARASGTSILPFSTSVPRPFFTMRRERKVRRVPFERDHVGVAAHRCTRPWCRWALMLAR